MNLKTMKLIFTPTKINKVDEHLMTGNAVFLPTKMLKLKRHNVTQIIDLRGEKNKTSLFLQNLEKFYCKCFGIKYKNHGFSLKSEMVPEKHFFDRINKDIIDNNGNTYMHCFTGKHRTGLGITMYKKNNGEKNDILVKDLITKYWSDYLQKEPNNPLNKTLSLFLNKFL